MPAGVKAAERGSWIFVGSRSRRNNLDQVACVIVEDIEAARRIESHADGI